MEFIKLTISNTGHYCYKAASNIAMNILGNFLSSDFGCSKQSYMRPTYQDWALDDSIGMGVSGNITFLEKEGTYIFLTDQYSEENNPTELKISRQQFVQLLDDWQEKVCITKPKEVIIRHENDQFIIETSN
jgi:hypothetical protein